MKLRYLFSVKVLTAQVERSDPPRCTVEIADSVGLDEIAAAEA